MRMSVTPFSGVIASRERLGTLETPPPQVSRNGPWSSLYGDGPRALGGPIIGPSIHDREPPQTIPGESPPKPRETVANGALGFERHGIPVNQNDARRWRSCLSNTTPYLAHSARRGLCDGRAALKGHRMAGTIRRLIAVHLQFRDSRSDCLLRRCLRIHEAPHENELSATGKNCARRGSPHHPGRYHTRE